MILVKIWKWLKLLHSVSFIKKTVVNHVYIRIWSSWLTFTALHWMKTNFKISQFEDFCFRVCDFGQNLKMTKTSSFCVIHQENSCESCLHSNLIILTDFHSFTVNEENFKIWKWIKLLNSVPFIKKTVLNQVYIRIWSFWLTFRVLQWMKKNFKIGQFSSFLLRSRYAI